MSSTPSAGSSASFGYVLDMLAETLNGNNKTDVKFRKQPTFGQFEDQLKNYYNKKKIILDWSLIHLE